MPIFRRPIARGAGAASPSPNRRFSSRPSQFGENRSRNRPGAIDDTGLTAVFISSEVPVTVNWLTKTPLLSMPAIKSPSKGTLPRSLADLIHRHQIATHIHLFGGTIINPKHGDANRLTAGFHADDLDRRAARF